MNNPPAFPRPLSRLGTVRSSDQEGMMLRDYFAAKAMQGMISNAYTVKEMHKTGIGKNEQAEVISVNSYRIADAMKEVNEELEGERPVWCSEHGRWECEEILEDGNTDHE